MELVRGIHNIQARHRGCVLTIGNFDGVHLGHQAVIDGLAQQAEKLGLPATAMVFEPQPQEYFMGAASPARLSNLAEKLVEFTAHRVERLLCVRFNQAFSALSADDFIEQLLVNKLGVRYLVVGDDFRFGRQRQGDFALLQKAGEKFGFDVAATRSFRMGEDRISSTLIRQALREDRLDDAATMLGRPYTLNGRVVHGHKRGRQLGFPTANLQPKRAVVPISGVYAVRVSGAGEQVFSGVANIGNRPTVDGELKAQLEVHLFGFEGNLYGKRLNVEFHHKLRAEKKFSSFEALQQQISQDAQQARQLLTA